MSENIGRNMWSSQGIINYPTQLHLVGHFLISLILFSCEYGNFIPLILMELCSVVREPVNLKDPYNIQTLTHV
jgi:hypothetical protein